MDNASDEIDPILEDGANENIPDYEFMTVGIGASAGGIKALKEFFVAMPPDPGMAFVIILHLSSDHESNLAQIIQSNTSMPVTQVTQTIKVEPNHIYVIPPAKGLAMVDGVIDVTDPILVKGKRVPIDIFFRTLADAYGKNGIAVILSGTGSDGTLGLKRIKENGGISIAQEPSDADYDGMPKSAIETGLIDLILPAARIPEKLIGIRDIAGKIRLPEPKDEIAKIEDGKDADALREILKFVRVRTGHDFANYKHATVLRRIARRLQVRELTELPEYLDYLRKNPEEADVLQRDFLITVTNFFRDSKAFDVLEKEVVPKLFADKTAANTVRVWSVATATGEEAYSLAILLDEYASQRTDTPKMLIFASDINDDAVASARKCRYDETIAADVSPERLARYFVKEQEGWRVRREIRNRIVFAAHNVLRDPPFSKLDLIVCRNLLIYLNRETQETVIGIFNFALRPGGYLFLGGSETADDLGSLFSVIDKKQRVYKSRPAAYHQFLPSLPSLPTSEKWNLKTPELPVRLQDPPESNGELHYQLVEQFGPPLILVNENYEVLHISKHAGRYLRVGGGEPTTNLFLMVHPTLKLDLRSALFEAKIPGSTGVSHNVAFAKGKQTVIDINVRRIERLNDGNIYYLITFGESAKLGPGQLIAGPVGKVFDESTDGLVQGLEAELQTSNKPPRSTMEQNETSTEELRAANEEMQERRASFDDGGA